MGAHVDPDELNAFTNSWRIISRISMMTQQL